MINEDTFYHIYNYISTDDIMNIYTLNKYIHEIGNKLNVYYLIIKGKYSQYMTHLTKPEDFTTWKEYYKWLDFVLEDYEVPVHKISDEQVKWFRSKNDNDYYLPYDKFIQHTSYKYNDGDVVEFIDRVGGKSDKMKIIKKNEYSVQLCDLTDHVYENRTRYEMINTNNVAFGDYPIDYYDKVNQDYIKIDTQKLGINNVKFEDFEDISNLCWHLPKKYKIFKYNNLNLILIIYSTRELSFIKLCGLVKSHSCYNNEKYYDNFALEHNIHHKCVLFGH
jgi:hypothetical protein